MFASMYTDKGDLMWIDFLQGLALPDRDQPVFGAMDNIGMTVYMPYPFIRAKMIT